MSKQARKPIIEDPISFTLLLKSNIKLALTQAPTQTPHPTAQYLLPSPEPAPCPSPHQIPAQVGAAVKDAEGHAEGTIEGKGGGGIVSSLRRRIQIVGGVDGSELHQVKMQEVMEVRAVPAISAFVEFVSAVLVGEFSAFSSLSPSPCPSSSFPTTGAGKGKSMGSPDVTPPLGAGVLALGPEKGELRKDSSEVAVEAEVEPGVCNAKNPLATQ